MPIDVSMKLVDHFLHVSVAGDWDAFAMVEALQSIRGEARKHDVSRIMIDCRELGAPKAEIDRHKAGEAVAVALPAPFRTAVIYRRELINKFVEDVATNRGAHILVTDTPRDAMNWLGIAHKLE